MTERPFIAAIKWPRTGTDLHGRLSAASKRDHECGKKIKKACCHRKTARRVTFPLCTRFVQELKDKARCLRSYNRGADFDVDSGFKNRMAHWVWICSRVNYAKPQSCATPQ